MKNLILVRYVLSFNDAVCDGSFFPSLLNEMTEVVGCFNERAQKLLELHLASGFKKYVFWFKGKVRRNHTALIQEGKDLVTYALINAIAIRKILKKYDKVYIFCLLHLTNAKTLAPTCYKLRKCQVFENPIQVKFMIKFSVCIFTITMSADSLFKARPIV